MADHDAGAIPPVVTAVLVVVAIATGLWFVLERPVGDPAFDVRGGDAAAGRVMLVEYGCASCHDIPGLAHPTSTVGPPLAGWADRRYIAGQLPNTAENLVAWIMDPQGIDPGNAMPDLSVPETDARAMAAYLATLQEGR